jgi:hypothetical protein
MAHTDNAWIGKGMKRVAEVYLELSFRVGRFTSIASSEVLMGKPLADSFTHAQASRISKDSKKDAVAMAMRRIQKSFQVAAQGND